MTVIFYTAPIKSVWKELTESAVRLLTPFKFPCTRQVCGLRHLRHLRRLPTAALYKSSQKKVIVNILIHSGDILFSDSVRHSMSLSCYKLQCTSINGSVDYHISWKLKIVIGGNHDSRQWNGWGKCGRGYHCWSHFNDILLGDTRARISLLWLWVLVWLYCVIFAQFFSPFLFVRKLYQNGERCGWWTRYISRGIYATDTDGMKSTLLAAISLIAGGAFFVGGILHIQLQCGYLDYISVFMNDPKYCGSFQIIRQCNAYILKSNAHAFISFVQEIDQHQHESSAISSLYSSHSSFTKERFF